MDSLALLSQNGRSPFEVMKHLGDLHVLHFNTSQPKQFHHECENAFSLWHHIWTQTFSELQVKKDLHSDEFLDRELGGLFLGDRPVGFILYRFLNASADSHLLQSYFGRYPQSYLQEVRALGGPQMALSYLTVAPDWRKSQTDLPVVDALFSLAMLRFKESDAKYCLGYARTDKKVHEVLYRHGASLIGRQNVYNADVEFTFTAKENATVTSHPVLNRMIPEMWHNRNANPARRTKWTEPEFSL